MQNRKSKENDPKQNYKANYLHLRYLIGLVGVLNQAQTRNPIGNLPPLSDFEKTIGVTNQTNSIAWYIIVRIFRIHMCNIFQQRFHVSLHVFWPTNCVKFHPPQFQEANCQSAANPLTRCNLPKLFASVVEPCHGETKY